MASGVSVEKDSAFYKKVMIKCRLRFIEDLDPSALLDVFLAEEYFTVTQERDIRELTNTSEKNREILAKVSAKGVKGYTEFKTCLIKSRQEHLAEYLDTTVAKLEEEMLAAQETSPTVNDRAGFKCSVCDLSYDTVQILEQHTQTPEHMDMIKEQQEFAKENQEENEDETGDFSSLASSMHEQNAINCNDQVSQCYLCNVRFTSPSHANSHLSGKPHKRRKALFDSEVHKPSHDSMENESVQQSSENVGQPNSQMSLPQDTLRSSSTTMSVDLSKTGLSCDICNVPFTSKYNAQQHYDSDRHKKKAILLQKQKLGEVFPMSCDICICSFTGQESAEAHFNSEKHRKAVNKAKIEGGGGFPLFCKICSCPFSSELNAKQHFESKKHKRKQELNEQNAETSIRNTSLGLDSDVPSTKNDVHGPEENGDATVQRDEDEVAIDLQNLSLCDK
ncbi:uncharacterized protein LOC123535048 [Mercenaria mercenaria]|uniref:uncharacterized protein LOC123535048 n=1 Tax=Mercenaria mercenaria TaxID=6596 RepID=UPI00234F331B|nr:uncharacterized protein LOC123535048 [Mercenaria mercenaria]XP_045173505.2 uncharacterized protein LOC123535048 [Mercenaria mercenaria]XP_045173506.2 uncharacterized protein LOC123535048 [Mercenaria mercenaria]XP_045173507.2 uncharacterized protein LOC123535048 [Mercenaria mercenaria]